MTPRRSTRLLFPVMARRSTRSLFPATLALALASAAHGAGTSLDMRCVRPDGEDARRIEIVSDGPNRVPCQTLYTKWGTRTVKADAANAEGYCETIASRIRGNLEAAGFLCSVESGAASALPTPARDSDPTPVAEPQASPPPATSWQASRCSPVRKLVLAWVSRDRLRTP